MAPCLRPTAPIAADAILVGDPGRALMLAQELLLRPKMSNHARGLWGYSGETAEGRELTIQSTGMGGPSATVVLRDLAELGVRRAIRIGTATSLGALALGELLIVESARECRSSFVSTKRTSEPGDAARPDPALTAGLRERLEHARLGAVVSLDTPHDPDREALASIAEAADMQTAALFAAAARHEVATAALLIITEKNDSGVLRDEDLEKAAKRAGRGVGCVLST